jgi:hypothetical protein
MIAGRQTTAAIFPGCTLLEFLFDAASGDRAHEMMLLARMLRQNADRRAVAQGCQLD